MKSLQFLFVGQPKKSNFKDLEEHYLKKTSYYSVSTQILYVKDSPEKNINLRNQKEGELLLSKIKAQDYVILCDEHGKGFRSVAFSEKLQTLLDGFDQIVFVIGGAFGVSDDVKKRANLLMNLSLATLPHELARVVLLEQVYRALSIARGEKYHHE